MKQSLFLAVFTAICLTGFTPSDDSTTLVVYCYDSFSSDWGPGPRIAAAFKEKTGIDVEYHAPGDGVTILNQLILEKDHPRGDVVVGLDNNLLNRVLEQDVLQPFRPEALENISPELILDKSHHLIPYDYGYFAICYDAETISNPPGNLEDLTKPEFADSLVLMDPRTSTPGLGFLLWTISVYQEDWTDYWTRLLPSILTVTDDWSQGYALFTSGEAPLVLSYGTSPVYHAEYEGIDAYRAAEFSEGHPIQIEGMGIIAGTEKEESAKLFIEFMLSRQTQEIIALGNIMMPVNSTADLPESFDLALNPTHTIDLESIRPSAHEMDRLITAWTEVFAK